MIKRKFLQNIDIDKISNKILCDKLARFYLLKIEH